MAISIITPVKDYSPAYNKIELLVDSDNKSEPNFRYVFEVFVEGNGSKVFKVAPEPLIFYGLLDIHNYLQQFVTSSIGNYDTDQCFEYAEGSIIKYNIEISEQWDVAGVPTADPDGDGLVDTSDLYAFEGALNHSSWIDFNPDLYLANTVNSNVDFLTDNRVNQVSINDLGWSYLMTDDPNQIDAIEVQTFDSSGATIDTYIIQNGVIKTETGARLLKIGTSPQSLNNVTTALVTTGTQPIITSNVASYFVKVIDNTTTDPFTSIYLFQLQEECRYKNYRLHFENRLGGFDSYTFTGRNQKSTSIKRTTYRSTPYNITPAGIINKHQDKGLVNNTTTRSESIKLSSAYLSTEENNWLEQLSYSPEVYLEFTDADGNRNLKSVVLSNVNSWIEKETIHDKLFKMELEIEIGHEAYSQRK